MKRTILPRLQRVAVTLLVISSLSTYSSAQSATTSSITGVVTDPQRVAAPGVNIVAIHLPSGTLYEAVTERDGRFFMPGMRVGGPYRITASLSGFNEEQRNGIMLSLGVTLDLAISLSVAAVSETVAVVAASDAVFSSTRTGAATGITRDELAALPTVSGRLNDFGRLTPQYGALGSFAGQDPRMNNVTVDGSYFNNSFGLRNAPGDTSGVAPISVEAIDQVPGRP